MPSDFLKRHFNFVSHYSYATWPQQDEVFRLSDMCVRLLTLVGKSWGGKTSMKGCQVKKLSTCELCIFIFCQDSSWNMMQFLAR